MNRSRLKNVKLLVGTYVRETMMIKCFLKIPDNHVIAVEKCDLMGCIFLEHHQHQSVTCPFKFYALYRKNFAPVDRALELNNARVLNPAKHSMVVSKNTLFSNSFKRFYTEEYSVNIESELLFISRTEYLFNKIIKK